MVPTKTFRLSLIVVLALLLPAALLLWYAQPQSDKLKERIAAAYVRGLDFLARNQLETGEFPTYAWLKDEEAKAIYVRTPFTASQILHSLTFGNGSEVGRRLRERAITYLLSHREPPGVWRYYGKDDGYYALVYSQFGHPKLPPDVDDTSLAWVALFEQGMAVDPVALATLKANRTKLGLFNTWIAAPEDLTWMDNREREVDLIVNLNALLLFARLKQPLPEVCQYVITSTQRKAFHRGTVWYPSPLAYANFLSRAYADGGAACLKSVIPDIRPYVLAHQQPDDGWGNDLETALGILTLVNTGERGAPLQQGITVLLERQGSDGGWATAPLYKGSVLYYGSRPLTTGFCLEALGKYLRR